MNINDPLITIYNAYVFMSLNCFIGLQFCVL